MQQGLRSRAPHLQSQPHPRRPRRPPTDRAVQPTARATASATTPWARSATRTTGTALTGEGRLGKIGKEGGGGGGGPASTRAAPRGGGGGGTTDQAGAGAACGSAGEARATERWPPQYSTRPAPCAPLPPLQAPLLPGELHSVPTWEGRAGRGGWGPCIISGRAQHVAAGFLTKRPHGQWRANRACAPQLLGPHFHLPRPPFHSPQGNEVMRCASGEMAGLRGSTSAAQRDPGARSCSAWHACTSAG